VIRRDQLLDVVAAAALATFCAGLTPAIRVTQPAVRPLDAGAFVLLIVAGGAVGLHRRRPMAAYSLSVGAATAYLAIGFPGWPVYLGAVGGLIALTAGVTRRVWAPLGVAGGVALAVATGRPEAWHPARMVAVLVVWCVLMVVAGEASVRRARLAEADGQRRVVEERLRIARELHDVLSHSLASISLQAGVGLHLMESDPDQAREALASIRSVSNDALAQARAALSVVRQPGEDAQLSVAPGLSELAALVASVRATGLDVDLDVDPSATASAEAEAAAYRVVQESLTNVMRHAGAGAGARVALTRRCQTLDISVTDNGQGPTPGRRTGHGLKGMAERVRALGGELEAGPRPDGGFVVHVRLPAGDRP
jgi:signal transduction histidine kinase